MAATKIRHAKIHINVDAVQGRYYENIIFYNTRIPDSQYLVTQRGAALHVMATYAEITRKNLSDLVCSNVMFGLL